MLCYLNFRVANLTIVFLAPKYAQFKGKYGQGYASKEKFYVQG